MTISLNEKPLYRSCIEQTESIAIHWSEIDMNRYDLHTTDAQDIMIVRLQEPKTILLQDIECMIRIYYMIQIESRRSVDW